MQKLHSTLKIWLEKLICVFFYLLHLWKRPLIKHFSSKFKYRKKFFQVLKYTFFRSRFYICIITSVLVLEQLFLKCTKVSPKCQYYCKSPLALASSQCFGGCNGKIYLNILRRKIKMCFRHASNQLGFYIQLRTVASRQGLLFFSPTKNSVLFTD